MTIITSSGQPQIKIGSRISLHFSLILEGGEEFETTRSSLPASLVLGDGNLLPGFEEAIRGLKAGDADQILIPARDAFGERNEENIRSMRKERFMGTDVYSSMEKGLIVSFGGPEGELPGVIVEVQDKDMVVVDFNHPLAGRDILFDVSILSVEDPVEP